MALAGRAAARQLALRVPGLLIGRGSWYDNQRLRWRWGWLDDFGWRAVGVGACRDGFWPVALIMR